MSPAQLDGQILDLFPASVSAPDGHISEARIHVANGKVRVFTRTRRSVQLSREEQVIDYHHEQGSRRHSLTILTASGDEQTWELHQARGCGCGNALRSFDPRTWSPS